MINNWNGKRTKYNPGTIFVCLKLDMSIKDGYDQLSNYNLIVRKEHPYKILEVKVPYSNTLEIAERLKETKIFRFIELDRDDL